MQPAPGIVRKPITFGPPAQAAASPCHRATIVSFVGRRRFWPNPAENLAWGNGIIFE